MHWSKTKEGRRKLRLQTKKIWRDGVFAKKVRVTKYRSAGNPAKTPPSALAIAQTLVGFLRREAKERRRAMKKLKKLLLE